jgi:L-iditol 2-dehydrogenase
VDAAHRLGAIATLVEGGAERDVLLAATAGRGVDAAIEIAGEDDALETAVILARPAGTVVVAGIPAGDHSTIAASIARRKGLDIRFSRRMNRTYPRAIAMVEAGIVEVSSLVTHRFAIAEFDAAFRIAVRRDGLKVLIRPSAA